jgi:hypothetical protein
MESIKYLRLYLGEQKTPLAYVVKRDEDVPAIDPDGSYATAQDEMIARAKRIPKPTNITNRDYHCQNHAQAILPDIC